MPWSQGYYQQFSDSGNTNSITFILKYLMVYNCIETIKTTSESLPDLHGPRDGCSVELLIMTLMSIFWIALRKRAWKRSPQPYLFSFAFQQKVKHERQ